MHLSSHPGLSEKFLKELMQCYILSPRTATNMSTNDRNTDTENGQSLFRMIKDHKGKQAIQRASVFYTFPRGRRKWQPTPGFLPGESQGRGSLVDCRLWGRTESDTTEVTQQQQQCNL